MYKRDRPLSLLYIRDTYAVGVSFCMPVKPAIRRRKVEKMNLKFFLETRKNTPNIHKEMRLTEGWFGLGMARR
jgi:hypothetical protein